MAGGRGRGGSQVGSLPCMYMCQEWLILLDVLNVLSYAIVFLRACE